MVRHKTGMLSLPSPFPVAIVHTSGQVVAAMSMGCNVLDMTVSVCGHTDLSMLTPEHWQMPADLKYVSLTTSQQQIAVTKAIIGVAGLTAPEMWRQRVGPLLQTGSKDGKEAWQLDVPMVDSILEQVRHVSRQILNDRWDGMERLVAHVSQKVQMALSDPKARMVVLSEKDLLAVIG